MKVLVFDLETTGKKINTCKICQLAFMIVDIDKFGKQKVLAKQVVVCEPDNMTEQEWIDAKEAFDINYLSRNILEGKNGEFAVLDQFANILTNYDYDYIVGQNIMEYDVPLLINRYRAMDFNETSNVLYTLLNKPCLDTKLISYAVNPTEKDHSLKNLSANFKIKQKKAHDAMDDVEVTLKVFKKFYESLQETKIRKYGLAMIQTPKYCKHQVYKAGINVNIIPICIKKKYVFQPIQDILRADMDYYNNFVLPDYKQSPAYNNK